MASTLASQGDYDLFCNQALADPYPLFDELRVNAPVHWCEPLNSWLVLNYDLCCAILRDSRFRSGRRGIYERVLTSTCADEAKPLIDHIDNWLQNQNPPRHTSLRKLTTYAVTPRLFKTYVPQIREVTRARLRLIREQGECDFISTFCYWLPATIICEMLGVPQNDHKLFQRLVGDLVPFASGAGPALNDAVSTSAAALVELVDYFSCLLEERRRAPRDDVISWLIRASVDGESLTQADVIELIVFLFFAGHETTSSLLGSGFWLLYSHPNQLAKVRPQDASSLSQFIEEIIRFESPVTRATRIASENIMLSDKRITKDATVTCLLNAANRDPKQFSNASMFDVTRDPNKHLGFGVGRHFCIGAELARLEARYAFEIILREFPDIRPTCTAVEWRKAFGIRSIELLPVEARSY